MNIDKLIEELLELKSCGVKNIAIVDTRNKDFDLESLEMNGESDLAFMNLIEITE